jgi:hypothetical protein
MKSDLRHCPRCLLPETVPALTFDANGLCNICQATPSIEELAERRQQVCRELEAIMAVHRHITPYACVVAFSGGKDSSYTLKMLIERHQLRCLAVTINNGFLSKGTAENCRVVCESLGVDHIFYTPNQQFVRRMYGVSAVNEEMHAPAAIQRASSICNSCIGLINTHILRTAIEVGAPLVAGGYIGGQLPKDSARMTIRPGLQARIRTAMVSRYVEAFGDDARSYFDLGPLANVPDREIIVINPMLGCALREEEIIGDIERLGWRRPTDTGLSSTNCRLNDLGIYIHTRRHGFHPYAFEIADQLRHGLATLEEATHKLETLPAHSDIAWMADRLKLSTDEI